MKKMKQITTLVFCVLYSSIIQVNAAGITLPDFAQNEDALEKATQIGGNIIEFLVGLIGILLVGGMSVSAALASSGNIEGAKKWAMGSLIGGSLASMAYGFAQFFV